MSDFKVQPEIKQEFLEGKPTATAKSNRFILKLVDDYEHANNKSVYDLSISERNEMIALQFRNSSVKTIAKNMSILRTYIDFCISKNLVSHRENRLATFTADDAKNFVNKQAVRYKYISREQLRKYQEQLENDQDKLLLELPYIGVRGRTQKDATLEELINLKIDPASEECKANILTLVKNNGEVREIQVSPETMQLVVDTYNQEIYIGNNGKETTNPKVKIKQNYINKVDSYVFRTPGQKKYEPLNANLINSRMHRIQEWIGNKYVTMSSLYFSGMVSMAKDRLAEKGSLDKEDYLHICARYDYGESPDKYWYVVKDVVKQYI